MSGLEIPILLGATSAVGAGTAILGASAQNRNINAASRAQESQAQQRTTDLQRRTGDELSQIRRREAVARAQILAAAAGRGLTADSSVVNQFSQVNALAGDIDALNSLFNLSSGATGIRLGLDATRTELASRKQSPFLAGVQGGISGGASGIGIGGGLKGLGII